ncbi:hypothetical protein BV898_19490 [Hypsibius exemplaris]|uniref:Uncharacterized protein n=1 Tax=Hypsibius exemplaris TaxID=2072580 RepID=A0A9X6NQS6_HYPEX|nr:hypothetical protein BV898_19490 [Hypsibius exemplaris]
MDSDTFLMDPRIIYGWEALQRLVKQEGKEDLLPHRTVFDDDPEGVIVDCLDDGIYGQQCDDENDRDLSNDVLELVVPRKQHGIHARLKMALHAYQQVDHD